MPLTGFDLVTSDDVGAPTLSGTNGDGNTVLNYILVTRGGWTRPFHDGTTNQSVFRMPAGSQRYLWVAHASAISGAAQRIAVRAAESASGFNESDLVDPFPLASQVATASSNWLASTTANATTRAWRAIVWDRGVHLFVQADGTWWVSGTFHDPIPRFSADTFATLIGVRNSAANAMTTLWTNGGANINGTSLNVFHCRSIDGLVKSPRGSIFTSSVGSFLTGGSLSGAYLGQVQHEALWTACSASTSATPSAAQSMLRRAAIPNLRNPLHQDSGTITSADFFTDSDYAPGCILRPLTQNANVAGPLLQETNDWTTD